MRRERGTTPKHDAQLVEPTDVIGIGQSREVGSTTVSVLSLERYADGFVVQLRLLRRYPSPDVAQLTVMPDLAVDDLGNRYEPMPHGGAGGGGRGISQWRHAFRFAPALAPEARTLLLFVLHIAWRRFDPDSPDPVEVERQDGPWEFAVALG